MLSWQIGEVKITRVVELVSERGNRFVLPMATAEALEPYPWLKPHFVNADGKLIMSIHALIVETGGRRIIVDTCLGNDKQRPIPDWNMRKGPFLQDLAAAGFPRESIDTVLGANANPVESVRSRKGTVGFDRQHARARLAGSDQRGVEL